MFNFFKKKPTEQELYNMQIAEAFELIKELNQAVVDQLNNLNSRLTLLEQVSYGRQHGSEDNS